MHTPHAVCRTAFFLTAIALSGALTGCSYPQAVHTYQYVVHYDRMTDRFDPLVSLVYAPGPRVLADYDTLFIDDITVAKEAMEDPQQVALYALRFRCLLQSEIASLKKFRLVTLDKSYRHPSTPGVLRLSGKVTVFKMGTGWLRYLLSLGATDFQVEGRITDALSGELVMEFVDRRRHLGNTPFGPNPRTFSGDFVMKVTIKETATCLARFIDKAYAGLPTDEDARDAIAQQQTEKGHHERRYAGAARSPL